MAKYPGRDLILSVGAANTTGLTSDASTDIFTKASHGLTTGDIVVFDNLTGGAGLVEGKRYYVIAAGLSSSAFAVSTTAGGGSFNHTTNVTAGEFSEHTAVGQVTSLGMSGSSRDLIDASAYGDDWKDYVVGQQDGTEVEVTVAYDETVGAHTAIKSAYDSGTITVFDMVHDDSGFAVSFAASVTALSRGGERDGLMSMTFTLKVLNPGVVDYT